jgi:hypothetical protein
MGKFLATFVPGHRNLGVSKVINPHSKFCVLHASVLIYEFFNVAYVAIIHGKM